MRCLCTKYDNSIPDDYRSCAKVERPLAQAAALPASAQERKVRRWRVGLLAFLLIALTGALPIALAGCDESPASTTAGSTTTLASSTTSVASPSTTAGSKGGSKVSVPDLVHLYLSEAEDVLSPLDLTADVVHEEWQTAGSSDDFVIYEQDPAPGTKVAPGSTVEVSIWRFGALMPNVVGKTEAEATQELELYLLTVNVVRVFATLPGNVGKVLAQDPAAGTPLNADGGISNATITVGKTALSPTVPFEPFEPFEPSIPPLVPVS